MEETLSRNHKIGIEFDLKEQKGREVWKWEIRWKKGT